MREEGAQERKAWTESKRRGEWEGGRLIFPKNTAFPSPRPCTLLLTNKGVLYTNQRPPAASARWLPRGLTAYKKLPQMCGS